MHLLFAIYAIEQLTWRRQQSELLLRQHHLDGIEHVVDVFCRDDERRLEGHDVAGDAVFADDEAAVLEGLENVIEFGGGGALVGVDEFGAGHEAEAADVADDRVFFLDLAQAGAQLLAALRGILAEVMLLDVVEHGEAGCRRDGVAAERRGARTRVGIGNLRRRDEGRDRRAVAERLGHRHDVRRHAEVLDGKQLARAREARLDLVDDEQRAVRRKDFLDALEVALRWHDDARIALDRLRDERARMAGRRGLDDVLDHVRAGEVTRLAILAERAAVAVRIRREMDAAYRLRVRAPHLDARHAHAELRAAVQAVAQRDDLTVLRVDGGEQQRAFRGLRARRAEECLLQLARRDLRELFREVHEILRQVDVADVLQRADLLLDLLRDLRVAVAAVHDRHPREAVEVLAPLTVVEVLHRATDELARLLVEMAEARHDVLLLLLDDGLGADIGSLCFFSQVDFPFLYNVFCPSPMRAAHGT